MIDSGATGRAFIDETFTQKYDLAFHVLESPRYVSVVDGRRIASGAITHTVRVPVVLGGHSKMLQMFVTKLGRYPIILGIPWLRSHNPLINWGENLVTFSSKFCQNHCLPSRRVVAVEGYLEPFDDGEAEPLPVLQSINLTEVQVSNQDPVRSVAPDVLQVSARSITPEVSARSEAPEVFARSETPDVFLPARSVTPDVPARRVTPDVLKLKSKSLDTVPVPARSATPDVSTRSVTPDVPTRSVTPDATKPKLKPLDISLIDAAPFNIWLKRSKKDPEFEVFAVSLRDIEKALAPKQEEDPAEKLPKEYHQFLSVFSKKEASQLPPHRPQDHKVPLKAGTIPPYQRMYGMSQAELLVVKKYIEENLSKGFIRASSSPAAAPILFVKKPGGGLRLCVDYRKLNELTEKDRYPLPLIKETLSQISRAKLFTKIDIIAAFNRLCMAKGEEWKTAFATRMGLFEYTVLPFGLTGGPASFQRYINDALCKFLDNFATAYLDDILIYSENMADHRTHVSMVLQRLQEFGLQADISKCKFHVESVKYLGLIVTTKGICMDPEKIQAIVEWQAPSCVRDLQAFLGFANFYWHFIKEYSKVTSPLTDATRKSKLTTQGFRWTADCDKASRN